MKTILLLTALTASLIQSPAILVRPVKAPQPKVFIINTKNSKKPSRFF
jgi:hypothetical protein